jgi:hypothetical protein
MGRARDLANILSSSGNVALDSEMGLTLITPTSIVATGGSGSISSTGAVSFTSASAISLNDVFSATYANYKVLLTSSGGGITLTMRFRVSGSDNSTANYNQQSLRATSTTIDGGRSTGQTSFVNIGGAASVEMPLEMTIIYPFASAKTGISVYASNSDDLSRITGAGGYFDATTSFTGFSIISSAGTITGTVRVYGYKN